MTDKDALPVQATVTEPVAPPQEPKVEPTEEPAEDEFDRDRAMATIKKLREAEKESKKALKELETLKAEKAQREEAELTELQKAQKRAEEAEAKAQTLEQNLLRGRIAAEAGLPAELAARLQGKTEDELKEDAGKLAALLPKDTKRLNTQVANPGNTQKPETKAQTRDRLFHTGEDAWDILSSKEKGAGVFFTEKE